jgi:antitoxin Phd
MDWQLADAKNRFSELVNRALLEGPQCVRRRGDAVVVVSQRDYEKLTGKSTSFKRFLMGKGPSLDGVEVGRDRTPMRNADL